MILAQNFNSTSLFYQLHQIKLLGVLPWRVFFNIVHYLRALLEVFDQRCSFLFLFGQGQINVLHQLINMENFLIDFFQTFSLIFVLRPKECYFASDLLSLGVNLHYLSLNLFELLNGFIGRGTDAAILHLKHRLFKVFISRFHFIYFLLIFVNQHINILHSVEDIVLFPFGILNLVQLQRESILVQNQFLNRLTFTLDLVVLSIHVLHLRQKRC
jgi:hypothetical protein